MNKNEFIECQICSSKTGSPLLCDSCYSNRILIENLKKENKKLKNEIENKIKENKNEMGRRKAK